MRNLILGNHEVCLRIAEIKSICEIVGKPFEEVFEERSAE